MKIDITDKIRSADGKSFVIKFRINNTHDSETMGIDVNTKLNDVIKAIKDKAKADMVPIEKKAAEDANYALIVAGLPVSIED